MWHDPQRARDYGAQSGPPSREQRALPEASSKQQSGSREGLNRGAEHPPTARQYVPPPVPSDRIVPRPKSKTHAGDPRQFQIQQIKRRFSPIETAEDGGTSLAFQMTPSDPDFPFELNALECVLHVPGDFARGGKPDMRVKNKEMGKGHQINVERGFDGLVEKMPNASLLGLMNALDRNLEAFLAERKADTIKIIPNAPSVKSTKQKDNAPSQPTVPKPGIPVVPFSTSTVEQKAVAQERRETETRQLEARLGRLPMFAKSPDGLSYTIPIDFKKRDELPVPLQAVKAIKLWVPVTYPLEPCTIEVLGVSREAATTTERAFERRAVEKSEVNLMGHINYLAQNMHRFATETVDGTPSIQPEEVNEQAQAPEDQVDARDLPIKQDPDRTHIIHVPRPPEWAADAEGEEDDEYESDTPGSLSDSPSDLDNSGDDAANPPLDESTRASSGPERGISLDFPGLELHGIELLTLHSLSITIKCLRCKTPTDISNLTTTAANSNSNLRSTFCSKCASPMTISYRSALIHVNARRAGYLDLDGCTVLDMLPSAFTPTCAQCSTSVPVPGVVAVRGDNPAMAICRTCHQKLSFTIRETKFLQISSSTITTTTSKK